MAQRKSNTINIAKREPLYYTWANMKKRCDNSNQPEFKNYGGRGITYDSNWSSFKNFKSDMSHGYSKELTLDRIDNNGDYTKDNCRWVTRKVQCNNKRNNRMLTHKGETMNLTQWAKYLNIKKSTLSMRFYAFHWSVEKCLTTPVRKKTRGLA